MAEQWEMCEVNNDRVYITTPINHIHYSRVDFIKRFVNPNFKLGLTTETWAVEVKLLSDGWEPISAFMGTGSWVTLFRRKFVG